MNFDSALTRIALWKSFGTGTSTPIGSHTPASDAMTNASAPPLSSSQKKRIRTLLKTASADSRHSQIDIQSYLLLPIQRIPRYRMLLESLLECTPNPDDPSQPDPLLSSALETIAQLAQNMNERKRDSEGRKRLVSFIGKLLLRCNNSCGPFLSYTGKAGLAHASSLRWSNHTVLF